MSESLFGTSSSESFTSFLCSADGKPIQKIYRHPAQIFLRDGSMTSASSHTSWTDEKHSLYLNYIEDAFVSSLYDRGYYTNSGKRWQADRREISSVNIRNSTEEVESLYTSREESQSESADESQRKTKKRKSEHGFKGSVPEPQSSKHDSATSKYRGQITENRQISEPSAKILSNRREDQVVPSMEAASDRETVRI